MKGSRFNEEQIIAVLPEHEAGAKQHDGSAAARLQSLKTHAVKDFAPPPYHACFESVRKDELVGQHLPYVGEATEHLVYEDFLII